MTAVWFDRLAVTRAATVGAVAALIASCGGSESTSPKVTESPPVKNVELHFCLSDYPVWVAMQKRDGEWARVLPDADRVLRMALGSTGGVAVVWSDMNTIVLYASAEEMNEAFPACQDQQVVGKTVSGTVAGVPTNDVAYVALGPVAGVPTPGDSLFVVQNVPDGARDLFAGHGTLSASGLAFSEFILRRGVNVAANGVVPRLDFHSGEAFPATTASVSLANFASSPALSVDLTTPTGVDEPVYHNPTAGAQQTVVGLPSSRLAPGDLHRIEASEQLAQGTVAGGSRFVDVYTTSMTNRTIALGPEIAQPTMSIVSSTPSQRWRVLLPVQAEYGLYADMEFDDASGRAIFVMTTRGFSAPGAAWDLTIPDFKNTSYDPTWALQPGTIPTWFIGAFGGDGTVFQNPTDGMVIRGSVLFKLTGSSDRGASTAIAGASSPVMERRRSLRQTMRLRLSRR